MNIKLMIDYEGNPYIVCSQGSEDIKDDLMEIFIRKIKKEGLVVVNEDHVFKNSNNIISIRLAKSSSIPINSKIVKIKE